MIAFEGEAGRHTPSPLYILNLVHFETVRLVNQIGAGAIKTLQGRKGDNTIGGGTGYITLGGLISIIASESQSVKYFLYFISLYLHKRLDKPSF